MNEWITDIRNNPPKNGVIVEVRGNWAGGDYVFKAKRKDYKEGCSKSQKKQVWRWVDLNGDTLTRKDMPDAWRPIA